ncbi:cell division protein ZipA [Idiomarina loihiensis]|jgi:cell division protein ZipA|uniref:cell division protein ZipA n=1 Tax=Idiomarina TaxID=135575 RepID=UPI00257D628A|nr:MULTISPECIES: cell division protein ZipA [unclassified Idiomarina]|tara:strand:- start:10457 stop:11416 length:960 start_codon:yes stop_codon:yes gene_type:complete
MGSLQITLSILGILAIAGIVAHGVWKIRKGNQQQRQREQRVAENRQQQSSGFDDDGIGEVRILKKESSDDGYIHDQAVEPKAKTSSHSNVRTQDNDADAVEQMSMDLSNDDDMSDSLPSMRVSNDETVEVEQTELKFDGDVASEPDDSYKSAAEQSSVHESALEAEPEPEVSADTNDDFESAPEEVIALHVKGPVQGAVLLQMMTELGCKFGELGIFHRYENTAGTGPMIFSVANMFNPGTFDLDNMENFETDGVAFFMALPMKFDGQQAFNMMLNAAKKLATEIPQGQVLDGQRQLLTRQSIHEARQRIREFERKHSA